ncbi:MAG: hypothetical protein M0035_01445 [Actinomycetota bacterium]|nr:hypothetical protein [Actinomycetota bacterium]
MGMTLAAIAEQAQVRGARQRCTLLSGLGNGRVERSVVVLGIVGGHVVVHQGLTRDPVFVPLDAAAGIGVVTA